MVTGPRRHADAWSSELSMLRLSHLRRPTLLGRFAIASAVPIVVLGVVLAHLLEVKVRARALADARQAVTLVARSAIEPQLSPAELRNGLTPRERSRLDRLTRAAFVGTGLVRVKVWNRRARIVYSDDRRLIGRSLPPSDELKSALAGNVASEVSNLHAAENVADRGHGDLLEVYVPLRFGRGSRPSGAFELYTEYRPIAAAISRDTRMLVFALVAGLLLLWVSLFRIVARASRTLRAQAEQNAYLALHDQLTGLPNRTLFLDRAEQALRRARREDTAVAVLLLDLDRFKEINDTLGHHSGDRLLQQVGPRLRDLLREIDTVARLGGDEFAILLPTADEQGAADVAERVRKALERPFTVERLPLALEASIGVALFPDHGANVEELLQRADVAMYFAKNNGIGYHFYEPDRDSSSTRRLRLLGELRRAVEQRELVVYYQPQVDAASGELRGMEALVRWQHPHQGLLAPAAFIPAAEHTGLITPLTLDVLRQTLAEAQTWAKRGLALRFSVNLSPRSLLDPALPGRVEALVADTGCAPGTLTLEITESAIMGDPFRALRALDELRALGTRLSIDDFGTGYSSLSYLKRLPVEELKIDKSFVFGMANDTNDAAIVRSTIDLARNLGLDAVAEGVESEAVWEQLRVLGCDLIQGFFLAPPLPPDDAFEWAERWRPGPLDASVAAR